MTDGAVLAMPSPTAEGDRFAHWRRNLLFIWVGVFIALVGANFVFPFMPFYLKELGVEGNADLGYWSSISASATGFSLTITAPLWGGLADRFGRKAMFLRAIVGAAIVIALMGLIQTPLQFLFMRFLLGAFAGTVGAASALVATITPRERIGYAMGALQTAQFSSNMLGPFIGGLVAAGIGIRQSFFFCAGLYLVAAFPVWFYVKEGRTPVVIEGGRPKGSGSLLGDLKLVMAERQVAVMLGLIFALFLGVSFTRPVLPLTIDDFSHTGAHDAADVTLNLGFASFEMEEKLGTGIVFGLVGLTSTIAALSAAPLGEHLGYRRSIVIAAVGAGLLYLPVAAASNYTMFLFAMGATGIFQGAMIPTTNSLIAAGVPDGKQGSAFGLAASASAAASLVGPLIGAIVNGSLGTPAVYASVAVVLLPVAFAAYLLVREPEFTTRPADPDLL